MSTRQEQALLESTVRRIEELIEYLRKSLVDREFYPPKPTKYEIARIVAARALQLANGAKPCFDPRELGLWDPVDVALEELRRGCIKFVVRRELPDGKYVEFDARELIELGRRLLGERFQI